MCAVRWKAAARSWLTRGTCRLVGLLTSSVARGRAGKGCLEQAAKPPLALTPLPDAVILEGFIVASCSCVCECLSGCWMSMYVLFSSGDLTLSEPQLFTQP